MERTVSLVQATARLGMPVDVTDSGPLPGMFVLAAHNDAAVRHLVHASITGKLGQLQGAEDIEDGHGQWRSLFAAWVRLPLHSLGEHSLVLLPATATVYLRALQQ